MSEQFVAFCVERNRRAMKLTIPVETGTFTDLADIYKGNPERRIEPSQQWLELAPRTQRDYRKYVTKIVAKFGQFQVSDFTEEIAVALRDGLRETPRTANYMLAVLSAMFVVALERKSVFGLVGNPIGNVKRLGKKAGVKPRTAYWTYEEERRFLEDADKADPVIALGMRLLSYSGQRPGSVRKMLLTDFDGSKINVVQGKTGAKVWIPCHKDLRPHLVRSAKDAQSLNMANGAFVRGIRGGAMGERYFATRWDAVAARTATMHLNRQDLRRTAVVRLAEAGCEVPQIASITGHSLKQASTILETYFVRTYKMAQSAITKLEVHQDKLKTGTDLKRFSPENNDAS
jgi:integrase